MLKNFLPYLQHLQALKKKPNPEPQEQNQSPNLLASVGDQSLSGGLSSNLASNLSKPPLLITSFLFKVILFIQAAFIIVFLINFFLNLNLYLLTSSIDGLSNKIMSFNSLVLNTGRIIDKTVLYKQASTERLPVGHYVDVSVTGAQNAVSLTSIKTASKTVSIAASAESPINFSVLLNNYFTNKDVLSVVLKTASLDTRANVFRMEIDVQFK